MSRETIPVSTSAECLAGGLARAAALGAHQAGRDGHGLAEQPGQRANNGTREEEIGRRGDAPAKSALTLLPAKADAEQAGGNQEVACDHAAEAIGNAAAGEVAKRQRQQEESDRWCGYHDRTADVRNQAPQGDDLGAERTVAYGMKTMAKSRAGTWSQGDGVETQFNPTCRNQGLGTGTYEFVHCSNIMSMWGFPRVTAMTNDDLTLFLTQKARLFDSFDSAAVGAIVEGSSADVRGQRVHPPVRRGRPLHRRPDRWPCRISVADNTGGRAVTAAASKRATCSAKCRC